MGIQITSVSETRNKDVFTDKGLYCGKVEDIECDLNRFKVRSLVVNAVRGSFLTKMLGNKKGVIIPFPMVEAIGDIIIIKHISGPITQTEAPIPREEISSTEKTEEEKKEETPAF